MTDEPQKVALETPDLAADYRAVLEALLPGVIQDGVVDPTRLAELMDLPLGQVIDGRERYGLQWAGKGEAVRSLLAPSRGALIPDLKASTDFANARNVFIEGDNLEVLKLLQKAYNDRVKVIYIDPPYNTGKGDLVYQDDFRDPLKAYLRFSGQLDDEGNRVSASQESGGRRHSRWASMMYPRLVLARNLLTQDGVIYISIDDHEVAQLRLILDEVFGPENFVENYIWESNFRPDNSSSIERENSQHVLCYSRNKAGLQRLVGAQQGSEGLPSLTKNSMAVSSLRLEPEWVDLLIPDGEYGPGDMGAGYTLEDKVIVTAGRATQQFRLSGRMIWGQKYLEAQAEAGTRIVIKSPTFVPYSKKAQTAQLPPTSLLPRSEVGDVLAGNAELKALFGAMPFNHPKPTSLISYLIRSATHDDKCATVLDFFAGSGSTAHAVALLNAKDGGERRVISVNLPEATPEQGAARELGYEVVSEVTLARIGKVLKTVPGAKAMGLRVYRLGESAFRDVFAEVGELDLSPRTTREGVDGAHVAAEVLLKEGVPLDTSWVKHEQDAVDITASAGVVVAVGADLTQEVVDRVLALGARVVVFLEDDLAGEDVLKANAFTNARNRGITMKTV
jgi:adenine-specific DNA-methyltransferase